MQCPSPFGHAIPMIKSCTLVAQVFSRPLCRHGPKSDLSRNTAAHAASLKKMLDNLHHLVSVHFSCVVVCKVQDCSMHAELRICMHGRRGCAIHGGPGGLCQAHSGRAGPPLQRCLRVPAVPPGHRRMLRLPLPQGALTSAPALQITCISQSQSAKNSSEAKSLIGWLPQAACCLSLQA